MRVIKRVQRHDEAERSQCLLIISKLFLFYSTALCQKEAVQSKLSPQSRASVL